MLNFFHVCDDLLLRLIMLLNFGKRQQPPSSDHASVVKGEPVPESPPIPNLHIHLNEEGKKQKVLRKGPRGHEYKKLKWGHGSWKRGNRGPLGTEERSRLTTRHCSSRTAADNYPSGHMHRELATWKGCMICIGARNQTTSV